MLNPIAKPSNEEIRKSTIVGFTERNDGTRIVRYVLPSLQKKPVPTGACVRPDLVFEAHVPSEGPATWWQVLGQNHSFDL